MDPIEYNEETKQLVARGEAVLELESTRIQADQIRYYQKNRLAEALGNISITHDGYRAISDRLSYDGENETYSIGNLRAGIWPYYFNGISVKGNMEKAVMEKASFYYGDPDTFTLNINSKNVTYVQEGEKIYARMKGVTFRINDYPFFYLPQHTHYINQAPYSLDLKFGEDRKRGGYLQTTLLAPFSSSLHAGVHLDFYTKRGLLAGPAAKYDYTGKTQSLKGSISTGFINDKGQLGTNVYGKPIDNERGFAEWHHKHHIGEHMTFTSSIAYWSDSEVIRDFREDSYNNNRQPDCFLEGAYAGNNYLLSAFMRFQPNDFYRTQQHLPEIRFDLLPVPIFRTGAYHKAALSYTHLKEDFQDSLKSLKPPVGLTSSEYDRVDFTYRIERPFRLTDWMTWTPLAGARLTHYKNQKIDSKLPAIFSPQITRATFRRDLFELGFDLEARAYANYPLVSQTSRIDGLRHIIRPVLSYRYYSVPDTTGEIAEIQRTAFDLNRSVLDLGEMRNGDDLSQQHLIRTGIENLYQTPMTEGYGSRTLAALNFYQDILLEPEKKIHFDGTKPDTLHATWFELMLEPAPWLNSNLTARFKTRNVLLESLNTRTVVKSGEIWSIGLSTEMLNKKIDQYRLDCIYRINERHSFFADTHYDNEQDQFTETQIGMHTRIGSIWQLIYGATFRNDAERESDLEFTLKLKIIEH